MKGTKKRSEKRISLHHELNELAHLLEGARLLADELSLRGEREDQTAALAIRAILAIAISRLHQLGRVLRGEADPRTILGPHNEVEGETSEHDVVLQVWPPGGKGSEMKWLRWIARSTTLHRVVAALLWALAETVSRKRRR